MRRILPAVCVVLTLLTAAGGNGFAQETRDITPSLAPMGTPIEVTAGQVFYAETPTKTLPAYRLDRPFKSSMAGSMGFPFAFDIDTDLLISVGQNPSGWEYFVPPDHKFHAYHSILGSVIRGRDTVGIRVGPQGQMEWFVDNSVYNKSPTIWTRRVKAEDPGLKRIKLASRESAGESVERLIYLGLTDGNRARVRLEKITPRDTVRDEFTFLLDKDGSGKGAVNGVDFTIQSTPIRATITVQKPFNLKIGSPVPLR